MILEFLHLSYSYQNCRLTIIKVEKRQPNNYCYRSFALVTLKMKGIVKETFTPIPKKIRVSVTR